MRQLLSFIISFFTVFSCTDRPDSMQVNFKNPPNEYRPMPFWHLNGYLTKEGIEKQITEAKEFSGFGGVAVLPVNPGPQHPTGLPCPGMTPEFLSDEFFDRYLDMLNISKELGTEIILYDDVDFPSGSANGKLLRDFPQYTTKFLVKEEYPVKGNKRVNLPVITNEPTTEVMALSAMNTDSKEIIDLQPYLKNSIIEWDVPEGEWLVMLFYCKYSPEGAYGRLVDYMQPEAVDKVMEMTYAEYAERFGAFFGNVITKTFFDDVGFVHREETWTPAITSIFKEKYGKNPALYYPALYYDIGPETHSARVAFYDIRSELMAEGYVKKVSEWSEKHHMKSMGHPPENYSPNTVVAHGDILKYYRHAHIPLLDAIFYYGRGLNGFKQISSAADLGDKPVVGAELCGAFPADMDSLTLYRVVMESMVRGVNFVVPHGMWYDSDSEKVRIPPVISYENPLLRDCLAGYSDFTARSCMMLQGGRRISDIALLWPIASVQAGSTINRDATSGLPVANWLPENVNHYQLSDILTNQVRRDFTYIHPEDLHNGKLSIDKDELVLNNTENMQHYKVLIIPGGEVISVTALKEIQKYYEKGGKVIATASLPKHSAEFGRDKEINEILTEIFGSANEADLSGNVMKSNDNGGRFGFIQQVSKTELNRMLHQMGIFSDVYFNDESIPLHETGYVNYIHKQKEGKDIYFITNTTEKDITTEIGLKGHFKKLEIWNPHLGSIEKISGEFIRQKEGGTYINLPLPSVSALFIVASK